MGTTEKLQVIKEILANTFMLATQRAAQYGLQFSYKSYPHNVEATEESEAFKAWHVDLLVKEPAYPEVIIQQFRYPRPDGIDAKNMEYHVLVEVMAAFTETSLFTWLQVGKMMNTDEELQKQIIHEATESNFTTDEPKQDL
jgi:hypothetical protein